MNLDIVRDGDREKILELQKRAGHDFPIPDPLTGFVVRDGDKLVAWGGWEPVAEVLGIIDPDLKALDKIKIWGSLHKPIESQIIRKGITVAYAHVQQSRFAAILKLIGWNLQPGYWLRREAGQEVRIKPDK